MLFFLLQLFSDVQYGSFVTLNHFGPDSLSVLKDHKALVSFIMLVGEQNHHRVGKQLTKPLFQPGRLLLKKIHYQQEQERDTVDDGNQDAGFGYNLACIDSLPNLMAQAFFHKLHQARVVEEVTDGSDLRPGDIIMVGSHFYENSLMGWQMNISGKYPKQQIDVIRQQTRVEVSEGNYLYDDFKMDEGIKQSFGSWQAAYDHQLAVALQSNFKKLIESGRPIPIGSLSWLLTNLVIVKSIRAGDDDEFQT